MMRGRLDVAIESQAHRALVTLQGRLDDATALTDLPSLLPAGDVAIDTEGVTFVNSVGMREWMRLIRQLRTRGRVTLERVADVLMTQMNLFPEFGNEGGPGLGERTDHDLVIGSFHAQYMCPKCGGESAPLIDAVAHGPLLRTMKAPLVACPECGEAMALADFPERYLLVFAPPPLGRG